MEYGSIIPGLQSKVHVLRLSQGTLKSHRSDTIKRPKHTIIRKKSTINDLAGGNISKSSNIYISQYGRELKVNAGYGSATKRSIHQNSEYQTSISDDLVTSNRRKISYSFSKAGVNNINEIVSRFKSNIEQDGLPSSRMSTSRSYKTERNSSKRTANKDNDIIYDFKYNYHSLVCSEYKVKEPEILTHFVEKSNNLCEVTRHNVDEIANRCIDKVGFNNDIKDSKISKRKLNECLISSRIKYPAQISNSFDQRECKSSMQSRKLSPSRNYLFKRGGKIMTTEDRKKKIQEQMKLLNFKLKFSQKWTELAESNKRDKIFEKNEAREMRKLMFSYNNHQFSKELYEKYLTNLHSKSKIS